MMRGRRDDEARLRWCFVGERCKHGVRGSTKSCEMVLLISPCPIKRWGWRMLMLNNKLCLTSVVEFLRRGRVDRGTGGGKVVVVVDSSKRKVGCSTLQTWQTTLPYREPGHKKHKKHTTTNMSRRRPTHQRLWPSLSMATSAMDLDLGAAAPYGSEAGAGRSVCSRRCWFRRLERRNRAHEKIERCAGPWP